MNILDPQPPPLRNDFPPVWDQVIADMRGRKAFGFKKYKTYLQPFNGRDASKDAYQEALDLVVYLRQLTAEWTLIQNVFWAAIRYVDNPSYLGIMDLKDAVEEFRSLTGEAE